MLHALALKQDLIVWEDIGDDASEVSRALIHLLEECAAKSYTLPRAISCLNLLLPDDAAEVFMPYLDRSVLDCLDSAGRVKPHGDVASSLAVYAWARRQPASERVGLIDILDTIQARQNETADNRLPLIYEALSAAWAEHCPQDERSSLLLPPGWNSWNLSEQIHIETPSIIFAEYDKRRSNPEIHLDELTEAAILWKSETKLARHSSGHEYRWHLSKRLLKALTPFAPISLATLSMNEADGWAHFLDQVKAAGYERPAAALRDVVTPYQAPFMWRRYLALVWPADQWRVLVDRVDELTEIGGAEVFTRLAQIVPPDETEIWRSLLFRISVDNMPIIAFSNWLPADKFHTLCGLSTELQPLDFDSAVCAYHVYLHSPKSYNQFSSESSSRSCPAWQASLLDRWIHAPMPLKPRRFAYGMLSIEDDFRLSDPLDVRGY